jgi:hypothetical protein
LVRATSEHVKCRVKVQNNVSEPFGTSVGLRHGDALSCILFNISLGKVVGDSGVETKGTTNIYNKTSQVLACADDIVLVGQTTGVLKEAIVNPSKTAQETGLNNQSAKN